MFPQAQSLPRRPLVSAVLPAEEATGAACCDGASPSLLQRFPSPHWSARASFRQEGSGAHQQPPLHSSQPGGGDTSSRGTAKSRRNSPQNHTAVDGGGHSSLVSHILQLNQTKIKFLSLPGSFTAILTSTKDWSSSLTTSPSSQRWQQL